MMVEKLWFYTLGDENNRFTQLFGLKVMSYDAYVSHHCFKKIKSCICLYLFCMND